MSYKSIKLSISDCESLLFGIAQELRGTVSADNDGKGLTQFSIEIPGQGIALLNVYDTAKGLTINPRVGKLQDISETIAKKIAESCETVAPKTYTFKSIGEDQYREFAEFSDSEYAVSPCAEDKSRIITKITSGRAEVTVTWFKTTHTLMIQGRTTPLWDEAILWFADKICEHPKDIIEIVFDSYEKARKTAIKYEDTWLEGLLKGKIMSVYGNPRILKDYEIKWLKTSLLLIELDIDFPEYYPCISSAIKVVEGMLRRICLSKFGAHSFDKRNFAQFEESPTGGGLVRLKAAYKSVLKDKEPIDYVEKLYNFMRTKRHTYSHNPGTAAAQLTKKEDAIAIFDELIDLIKESSSFTKVLF